MRGECMAGAVSVQCVEKCEVWRRRKSQQQKATRVRRLSANVQGIRWKRVCRQVAKKCFARQMLMPGTLSYSS